MLYLEHDFYSNFNSGVNSGDNELLTDMIVNELSELIVYRTPKIIDLLEKLDIKISAKSSNEKIVDTIIQNLSQNVKLIKGLAFLISENNDASKSVKVVVGKDGKERKIKNQSRAANVKEIDMVASGLMGIVDSFKYKPQLKKEFKIKLMRVIETKSNAVGDSTRKLSDNKNGKYVFFAIVVIAAAIGTYFYIKSKKKLAAEGMLVDGATPPITPPVPTPVAQPIVTPVAQPIVTPVAQPIAQPVVSGTAVNNV